MRRLRTGAAGRGGSGRQHARIADDDVMGGLPAAAAAGLRRAHHTVAGHHLAKDLRSRVATLSLGLPMLAW